MEKEWKEVLHIESGVRIKWYAWFLNIFVIGFIIRTDVGLSFEIREHEVDFSMKPIYFWTDWITKIRKWRNPGYADLIEMKTESNGAE